MPTYEWRVAKNGTRRYVRIEAVPAPAPKGPQPVESDASIKVVRSDTPRTSSLGTVTPAAAATMNVTTRRRTTKRKPRTKKPTNG